MVSADRPGHIRLQPHAHLYQEWEKAQKALDRAKNKEQRRLDRAEDLALDRAAQAEAKAARRAEAATRAPKPPPRAAGAPPPHDPFAPLRASLWVAPPPQRVQSIDHRAQNKAELDAQMANVSWKRRPQDGAGMGSGMGSGMSTANDRAALRLGPLSDPPSAPPPAAPRSAPAPLTGEQQQQQKEQAAALHKQRADALREKTDQKQRERLPLEVQYKIARTFLATNAELVHALEVLARPEVAAAQALVDAHAWSETPLIERIAREQKLLREAQPDQPQPQAEEPAQAKEQPQEQPQPQPQVQVQPQSQPPHPPQSPESLQSPALAGPSGRAVEAWPPPTAPPAAAAGADSAVAAPPAAVAVAVAAPRAPPVRSGAVPPGAAPSRVKTEELQPAGGAHGAAAANGARAKGGAAGCAGSAGVKDAAGAGVKTVRPKSEKGAPTGGGGGSGGGGGGGGAAPAVVAGGRVADRWKTVQEEKKRPIDGAEQRAPSHAPSKKLHGTGSGPSKPSGGGGGGGGLVRGSSGGGGGGGSGSGGGNGPSASSSRGQLAQAPAGRGGGGSVAAAGGTMVADLSRQILSRQPVASRGGAAACGAAACTSRGAAMGHSAGRSGLAVVDPNSEAGKALLGKRALHEAAASAEREKNMEAYLAPLERKDELALKAEGVKMIKVKANPHPNPNPSPSPSPNPNPNPSPSPNPNPNQVWHMAAAVGEVTPTRVGEVTQLDLAEVPAQLCLRNSQLVVRNAELVDQVLSLQHSP